MNITCFFISDTNSRCCSNCAVASAETVCDAAGRFTRDCSSDIHCEYPRMREGKGGEREAGREGGREGGREKGVRKLSILT